MYKYNNNYLVSVALCTYNGEKYLKEQLDSIIQQSYKNIEIIICDDCSTDNTINIVNEYITKYDFIKLYRNTNNLGFKKNFEKAIYLCKGFYIALSDQDDIWDKNKLEVLIDNINDNVLIYSNAKLIDKFGNYIDQCLVNTKRNLVSGRNNKAFLFDNCVSGNTILFKRALVKYILPIPNEVSFHDIWIAFVAATYGSIGYYHEPLISYRRYPEQVTHVMKNKDNTFLSRLKEKKIKKVKSVERKLENLYAFLSLDILDEDCKYLIEELISHFENYSNTFFNINTYKLLQKNKNKVFEIENIGKRKISLFKISCGLRFYKYTLYII